MSLLRGAQAPGSTSFFDRSALLLILLPALSGCPTAGDPDPEPETPPEQASGPCSGAVEDATVGLTYCDERSEPGYTLFTPLYWPAVYLIDQAGSKVHEWVVEDGPGSTVALTDDGDMIRLWENTGVVHFGWTGEEIGRISLETDVGLNPHHSLTLLPNGNVLVVASEDIEPQVAEAAGWIDGAPFAPVKSDRIVELDLATGDVVWEWRLWDHLVQDYDPDKDGFGVVADNPQLVDVNGSPGWGWGESHVNSVAYNAELDQILVSALAMKELWIIDHSTTTEEAAGHTGGRSGKGGDLLWRWGNPEMYDANPDETGISSHMHAATWIPEGSPGAGNVLVFANGYGGEMSAVLEIETPVTADGDYVAEPSGTWGPVAPVWIYEADDLASSTGSSAQRLPGGNTLICEQLDGRFVEVTPDGDIVWEYINPVATDGPAPQGTVFNGYPFEFNAVFRVERLPLDHPAFAGRTLQPGPPLELPTR